MIELLSSSSSSFLRGFYFFFLKAIELKACRKASWAPFVRMNCLTSPAHASV